MTNNYIKKLLFIILTALIGYILPTTQALSAPIQRTITIDGNTSDWKTAPNITTNPGQFSTDAEGDPNTVTAAAGDLDYPIQSTGRDLERFSYTYDNTNLYMWVERYASSSNRTDWWFYLDVNNDGILQTGEKLLNVIWTGSNGTTRLILKNYIAAASSGDPLLCPATGVNSEADNWCPQAGVADGYDMPGTILSSGSSAINIGSYANQSGGTTSGTNAGIEMETKISWALLGLSGPSSLKFHIASSNGKNLPAQINDNMDGPGAGGGSIAFSELAVTKTASVTSINMGSSFTYSVTVTNNGDSAASNVSLDDVLPTGVTYASHIAPAGTTYDNTTGLWTIGSLPFAAAPANAKTLSITVTANVVASDTVVTNTANNLQLDQGDPNTTNNAASVDVTVLAVPIINLQKTSVTLYDPINLDNNPKAIPGATAEYTISATNSGTAPADANSIIISDAIPANTALFVGAIPGGGGGPISFIEATSGLTYVFSGLPNDTDNLGFSQNGGVDNYLYHPTADSEGLDTSVTHIKVSTAGQFLAPSGSGNPAFQILFRVKIQ